jgi:hypothetical protein
LAELDHHRLDRGPDLGLRLQRGSDQQMSVPAQP